MPVSPIYDKDGITVYCADNREVDLPVADLIITDPPYSDVTHKGARTNAPKSTTTGPDGKRHFLMGGNSALPLGIAFDHITDDDVLDIFGRLALHTKRWIVSFVDWRHAALLEAAIGEAADSTEPSPLTRLRFVRAGVWVGPNKAPQFTGDRPGTGWEALAFLHRSDVGRMRWNGGGRHSVYTYNVAHKDHRISDHPNAKPFQLVAQLIRDFSDEGDLVLDPFGGSGVVAAACVLLGRRCVIIEKNQQHCDDLVFWLTSGRVVREPDATTSELQATLWDDEV
jgi:site-specific DNA-methyltransferase (adenine-specific)